MSRSFPSSVNLLAAAERLTELWTPKVVAQVNDHFTKVVKILGQLAWHSHAEEDEMFMVLKGRLRIEYEDRASVELSSGDVHVVPKGVLHNPVADDECLMALFEPVTTRHTGEVVTDRTRTLEQQLSGAS